MLKRLLRSERGFTLVELLVTIAIMAVLFGIVTLALNSLTTNADANAQAAELDQVQTAMDIYLAAEYPTGTIAAGGATTDKISEATTGFSQYIRGTTAYCYTWGADGSSLAQDTDCQ